MRKTQRIGVLSLDLLNTCNTLNTLKHFISNLHFVAPPSDPLSQRIRFNFWYSRFINSSTYLLRWRHFRVLTAGCSMHRQWGNGKAGSPIVLSQVGGTASAEVKDESNHYQPWTWATGSRATRASASNISIHYKTQQYGHFLSENIGNIFLFLACVPALMGRRHLKKQYNIDIFVLKYWQHFSTQSYLFTVSNWSLFWYLSVGARFRYNH